MIPGTEHFMPTDEHDAERVAEERRRYLEDIVTRSMEHKPTRLFIWAIMTRSGLFDDSLEAVDIGRRSVATDIMRDIMAACSTRLFQMWSEAEPDVLSAQNLLDLVTSAHAQEMNNG